MLLFTLIQIIDLLVNVLVMLIIVQFVIGLLLAFNVINASNQFVVTVYNSINALLEPVLGPIRRIMPNTGGIDFSPLVLIVVLQVLLIILSNLGEGERMSATLIDGKAFAEGLRKRVGTLALEFETKTGRKAGLAAVLVGEDPASQVYVRNKGKQTLACGMASFEHKLAADTPEAELLALVERLNDNPAVDGILVQLPLPRQMDEAKIIAAISPDKDVDGFHVINTGRLAVGQPGFVPCTPLGCMMLLKDQLGDLSGLDAVVIGRSNIVGKPMAQLLLQESCTVTMAHSRTRDLPAVVRRADIVVAAVGRPEMIEGNWIKPGATVIDVGINRIPAAEEGKTKLVGDIDYAGAAQVAGAITPVPGGVGPMTIAVLLRNTLVAAHRNAGIALPAEAI